MNTAMIIFFAGAGIALMGTGVVLFAVAYDILDDIRQKHRTH